jgi:A/G-specific adenine glycosylase
MKNGKGRGMKKAASDSSLILQSLTSAARQRLLRWFSLHARSLPWRANRDPYRIWVSEVMLQQTQVATVIPYFERFLNAFPTLTDLAAADEQDVLRLWEGLGYYRRARHLHQSARKLVQDHAGALPDDPEIWRQLPGVGKYILGAVLSQAFGRQLPIVEANTKRLLCRLFGRHGDPKSSEVTRWLWQAAQSILPKKQVGDFNQALMELGSQICTPTNPRCAQCPLKSDCTAYREGLQEKIPTKLAIPPTEEVRETAVVIRRGSRVLLVRRPSTGRWANMWEFPHSAWEDDETDERVAQRILKDVGIEAEVARELKTIKHPVTRFRITMVCWEAIYRSGRFRSSFYEESRWLKPADLHSYPVSSPQRKLALCVQRAPS